MKIAVSSEQEILQEGEAVLIEHLGMAKAARFFSAWRQGVGNYLAIREKLFEGETVDTLYNKITDFEKKLIQSQ
jgi:hypothetical protein